MNDISIDLETLSTRHDAAILSIGAQLFDRHTGELGASFYQEVDLDSAIGHGHVSGSTLAWWVSQGEDAQRLFSTASTKPHLPEALSRLAAFVVEGDCIWGNGATFDITILEHAFTKCGMEIPWQFWSIRDMRTIVDVAGEVGFNKSSIPFTGTPHHALHDATHQAKVIAACWRAAVPNMAGVMAGVETSCV